MTNQELAKLAISNENTPELGQYWQKRYEKFLKSNVFILSEKTELLLEQKELIDSPATPYGYLNLPVFLGKNKIVDEVMLQNCIETTIRFLDSILDTINFTTDARQLINQNRKIGLGVVNFEEYFTNRDATSKVEEIDYIGEIISSSSYRASEALAEEKGPCDNWNNLAFMIRPKPFEYWYNSETGEVKSGLDITEEFTSTNLLSSHFEIIPRRNSHILLYPNDQEWQIWSDRDDNSKISTNLTNQNKTNETPIISTGQDDDNDYMPSFEQEMSKSNLENIVTTQSPKVSSDSEESKTSTDQFINPAPIEDLPLINPISTLQQKISKWFAVDSTSSNTTPENSFDLSNNSQKFKKTANDLPIPKVREPNQESVIITQIKEVEVIKEVPIEVIKNVEVIREVPVEVIREVEVIKEINKSIFIQIVSLSGDAKKVLVDQNNKLPSIIYNFEKEIEVDVIEKINQKFGVQIDFMEISSVDLLEDQIYIVYQAKIQELGNSNSSLNFDYVEALNQEQDTVAYSKSIDRVRRWHQSSRIKAQELLKEYNQNLQKETNESESKIIVQKNSFIEELQTRIQKLIIENEKIESDNNFIKVELKNKSQEIEQILQKNSLESIKAGEQNSDLQSKINSLDTVNQELQTRIQTSQSTRIHIEEQKNKEIDNLNIALDAIKSELQAVKSQPIIVDKILQPIQSIQDLEDDTNQDNKVVLVKNDNLMFDLTSQTQATNQPTIPTININTNTNYMPQNEDLQSDIDANQATFKTSRDKMFMPTLEIETKLGVPVIVNTLKNYEDDTIIDQPNIINDNKSKSPSHAANVLLKLKKLTR